MKTIRHKHPRVGTRSGVREHPMEVAAAGKPGVAEKRMAKSGALTQMRNMARKDGHKVVGNMVHKTDGTKVNLSTYARAKVIKHSGLRGT